MSHRQVHIRDANGIPIYNLVRDDGSLVLTFESEFGMLDRLTIEREGWQIVAGWLSGERGLDGHWKPDGPPEEKP